MQQVYCFGIFSLLDTLWKSIAICESMWRKHFCIQVVRVGLVSMSQSSTLGETSVSCIKINICFIYTNSTTYELHSVWPGHRASSRIWMYFRASVYSMKILFLMNEQHFPVCCFFVCYYGCSMIWTMVFAYEFLLVSVCQLIGNISFHVFQFEKPQIKTKKYAQ